MTNQPPFDAIAHYLRNELFPNSELFSQRVMLGLYRLIALGSPVSLEELGATLGVDPDAVKKVIAAVAPSRLQYDGGDRVVAFAGLSQTPAPHRFSFSGRELFTWCAFDALFLPEVLGGSAQITSSCPVTEAEIHLTVTSDGPEAVAPRETVMSFVMPSADNCCTDLRGVFCNHVNFLASRQAAAAWSARNPDAAILSLSEAFALGRIRNESAFGGVLKRTTTTRGAA
jgi:alkylmercury lyase